MTFTRASVGSAGHQVTATTNWNVEWEGVEADGTPVENEPPLDDLDRQATFNVPVAESQAIVRGD